MQKSILFIFILSISIICYKISSKYLPSHQNKIASHYKNLTYPSFTYHPPNPKKYKTQLNQNVTTYFYPSHLDIIEINIYFLRSNTPKNLNEKSIQILYENSLISGGTKTKSPTEINALLENTANHISIDINENYTQLNLEALSKNIYPLLNLTEEIITQPQFNIKILNLNKKRIKKAIKHKYDKPSDLLNHVYDKIMYGNNINNQIITNKLVNSITQENLLNRKSKFFQSSEIVISIAGNYEKEKLKIALNKLLTKIKKNSPPNKKSKIKFSPNPNSAKTYFIEKNTVQANIKIGFPGIKRPHPDYYPLTIANYILGGSAFSSKLTKKIRTEEGFAYSVYSFIESDYFKSKTIGIFLQTKNQNANKSINMALNIIQKLIETGISKKELENSQNALIQKFPSIFENEFNNANIFALNKIWKRNSNHFYNYPKLIKSITLNEVNRVLKKYFNLKNARIIIVGNKNILKEKKYSHLKNIKILSIDSLNNL